LALAVVLGLALQSESEDYYYNQSKMTDIELLHTDSSNCDFLEDMWRYDCASRII